MNEKIRGIVLCLVLTIPAYLLGKLVPIIGGAVFAIILGLIIGNITDKKNYQSGINFTGKKVLQYSIVLLGFQMNFYTLAEVGRDSLAMIFITLGVAFVTCYIAARLLKTDRNVSILVGVGTSICGGSAIAATAPVIEARDDEIATAISTIFLFNVIAALIFPQIGQLLGMSDTAFGMWAGTAINDTSSVVASGTVWSEIVGNDTALNYATIVKLTRTLMIIPITLVLSVYIGRVNAKKSGVSNFSLKKIFPFFIIWFVVAALINTIIPLPEALTSSLTTIGKYMICMAMMAIGLNTNIKNIINNGKKPMLLGLIIWIAVIISSLAVQYAGGMM